MRNKICKQNLFLIILIMLLLFCSCEFNPVKRIEYYPVKATIDSVHKGKVYLEYGNQFSEIDNAEFYDYCLSRIGETVPATLIAAFAVNHQISYRIVPKQIYN